MTVDVEDYFHTEAMSRAVSRDDWRGMPSRVERNTERMFELFAEHNTRGTFFFLGWVAERFPRLIEQAMSLGHEIGCHSYWHRPIYRLDPAEFREDTIRAKRAIEDAAGIAICGYRAPSFSLTQGTEWAAEILAELGFSYDSSVHPIRHDLYSNPSAPRTPFRIADGALTEFPIATVRIAGNNIPIGGGGYFRAFPYAYARWGFRRLNKHESLSGVFYIHPWEIDVDQPRISSGLKSAARQYRGLATTWPKLEKLCSDFRWVPMSEAFRTELSRESRRNGENVAETIRPSQNAPASLSPVSNTTTRIDGVE